MFSSYLCPLVLNRHITGKNFRAKYKINEFSEQKVSPKGSRMSPYQLYDIKPVAWILKRVWKQMRTSFQKGLQKAIWGSTDHYILLLYQSYWQKIKERIDLISWLGNKCGKSHLAFLLVYFKSHHQTPMRTAGWHNIGFAEKWRSVAELK